MKKYILFLFFSFIASLSYADRLGGLRSDANVQLTTQTVTTGYSQIFNAEQAKMPGTGSPSISNSTNAITGSVLFDPGITETVIWSTILKPWNAGALSSDLFYTMASGSTGTVNFGVYVMCVTALDNADVDTASFGSINSSATVVGAVAGYMTKVTIVLTNEDACAVNDLFVVKLERTSGDTAAGIAEFRKMRIYE